MWFLMMRIQSMVALRARRLCVFARVLFSRKAAKPQSRKPVTTLTPSLTLTGSCIEN